MVPRSALPILLLLLTLPGVRGQPARPRGDGAALAGRPVLTTSELDGLEFSTARAADRKKPESQVPPDADAEGLALGVWVSRREYCEGEPIPVLLALRNTGAARDLDLRIDLTAAGSATYNGAALRLERTDPGNTVQTRLNRIWVCGGRPLGVINRGGYHCLGGDLRALGAGRLPRGSYRLFWGYRGLKSNVAEFTVLPAREPGAVPSLSRRPLAAVVELARGKLGGLPNGPREHALRLTGVRAYPCQRSAVAAHLASGVAGKYYPALADLPVLDGGLQASARFLRRGPGETPFAIEVTLRAAHFRRDLRLNPHLRLALLIEPQLGNPAPVAAFDRAVEGPPDGQEHHGALTLDRPVRLTVELPAGWERHAGFGGPARVAVLLSTEDFRGRSLRRTESKRSKRSNEGEEWRGVLRTPWLDLELPAARK